MKYSDVLKRRIETATGNGLRNVSREVKDQINEMTDEINVRQAVSAMHTAIESLLNKYLDGEISKFTIYELEKNFDGASD